MNDGMIRMHDNDIVLDKVEVVEVFDNEDAHQEASVWFIQVGLVSGRTLRFDYDNEDVMINAHERLQKALLKWTQKIFDQEVPMVK